MDDSLFFSENRISKRKRLCRGAFHYGLRKERLPVIGMDDADIIWHHIQA